MKLKYALNFLELAKYKKFIQSNVQTYKQTHASHGTELRINLKFNSDFFLRFSFFLRLHGFCPHFGLLQDKSELVALLVGFFLLLLDSDSIEGFKRSDYHVFNVSFFQIEEKKGIKTHEVDFRLLKDSFVGNRIWVLFELFFSVGWGMVSEDWGGNGVHDDEFN